MTAQLFYGYALILLLLVLVNHLIHRHRKSVKHKPKTTVHKCKRCERYLTDYELFFDSDYCAECVRKEGKEWDRIGNSNKQP
jgi:hypothetical protein